jgi:hypothetical protein
MTQMVIFFIKYAPGRFEVKHDETPASHQSLIMNDRSDRGAMQAGEYATVSMKRT